MSGAKIKNIVILLLLAVDLVLLCVFGTRQYAAARIERQAVTDALAALDRLGLNVDRELLEADWPTLYTLEEERDLDAERALWAPLLGSGELQSQGGGLYTAETERGRLRLSNAGTLELVLYPPLSAGFSAEMPPSALLALCGEPGAQVVLSGGSQVISGVRVFDRDLTLRQTGEGLQLSGGLLLGELYISDGSPAKGLTAALLTLAGERKNDVTGERETVTGAERGYVAELLAENYATLRPVWRITTDKGAYTVDALALTVRD